MLNLFTSYTQKMNKAVLQDLENYESGWLLTLNAITTDFIKHENLIRLITYWINKHCYGRAFKRGEKRLRIVSASEIGTINQGLHSHLIIMHNNDIRRTFKQIEAFVHKQWYLLINANYKQNHFRNLVDYREIDSLEGCLEYITKTYEYYSNDYNLQYF